MLSIAFTLLVCVIADRSYAREHQNQLSTEPTSPLCRQCLAGMNQTWQYPSEVESSGIPQCSEQEDNCPSGYYCQDGQCECLPPLYHILTCNNGSDSAAILNCYCMTQNRSTNVIQLGKCLYNCGNRAKGMQSGNVSIYSVLPRDLNEL